MLNSFINLAKISVKIFLSFLGLNFMLLKINNFNQILINFTSNSIQFEHTFSNTILWFHPVIFNIFFNGLDSKGIYIWFKLMLFHTFINLLFGLLEIGKNVFLAYFLIDFLFELI